MRKKDEVLLKIDDPVELVCIDLISNLVNDMSAEIARETLSGLGDEYIIESQYITYFRRVMLTKFINETIREAVDEMIIEQMVDRQIAMILSNIAEPLALLCAEEEYYEKEGEEIQMAFESLQMREITAV